MHRRYLPRVWRGIRPQAVDGCLPKMRTRLPRNLYTTERLKICHSFVGDICNLCSNETRNCFHRPRHPPLSERRLCELEEHLDGKCAESIAPGLVGSLHVLCRHGWRAYVGGKHTWERTTLPDGWPPLNIWPFLRGDTAGLLELVPALTHKQVYAGSSPAPATTRNEEPWRKRKTNKRRPTNTKRKDTSIVRGATHWL